MNKYKIRTYGLMPKVINADYCDVEGGVLILRNGYNNIVYAVTEWVSVEKLV